MIIRIFFLLIFLNQAHANSKYIVLSSTEAPVIERIDTDDLRDIYLGNRIFWKNGKRIFPSHIEKSSDTMKYFLNKVLSMNPRQYNKYWRRRLFSGKGHPPIELENDNKTLDYVKKTNGALGLVDKVPRVVDKGLYFFQPSTDGYTLKKIKN